jgi:hypothetical protein
MRAIEDSAISHFTSNEKIIDTAHCLEPNGKQHKRDNQGKDFSSFSRLWFGFLDSSLWVLDGKANFQFHARRLQLRRKAVFRARTPDEPLERFTHQSTIRRSLDISHLTSYIIINSFEERLLASIPV